MSVSTFPLMPATVVRRSPNRIRRSLRAMTIIAVHLFAIRASDVRDGQVANITSQTCAATPCSFSYVEVTGYRL